MENCFKKLVLKISGEGLKGDTGIFNDGVIKGLAETIVLLKKKIDELGIVIGGGNSFRGSSCANGIISHAGADRVGISATITNAIMLFEIIDFMGGKAKIFTPPGIINFSEQYTKEKAIESLKEGNINIYAGGTGEPGCTTDTAAVIKAYETKANLVKMTKVDGVYNKDPNKYIDAEFYPSISIEEIIRRELMIMDLKGLKLAFENGMLIYAINMSPLRNIIDLVDGKKIGTKIYTKTKEL